MGKDSVVEFRAPEAIEDPLTELLRTGARQLIQQAIEAELAELLAQHEGEVDAQGRRAVVRNGYLPEREILTGVGPVPVKVPKVRSRTGDVCQDSCRNFHAARTSILSSGDESGLLGLRYTTSGLVQFRMVPLQRSGWRALAVL